VPFILTLAKTQSSVWFARSALLNNYRKLERQLALLDRKIAAWSKVSLPEKQVNELLQRASMFEMRDPAAPRGLLLTGPPGTGKTLIARSVAESMQCHYQQLSIADLKQQQLGASGQRVREVWNQARNNQPAVIFLDECEGILGRRGAAETDVISADIVQAFLAEWDGIAPNARVWVIGATNRRDMLDDAILSRFGWEMAIALPGAAERARIFRQEMEAVFAGYVIPEEMASLTQGMSGRDVRHLASQVRTLAYPNAPAREHYLEAVKSSRKANNTKVDTEASWETLVLVPPVMERLKLTCTLVRDAETWRAQGVTVPRSLLLTGPPGSGKTQIARTLANESGLGFLAATTADVKANFLGQSGNRVKQLFERARANAPVILFLDELDIIAPARTGGNDALTDEIVAQLLQELDGIQSRDSEVFLLAATNHVDQIDPAVLSRFQERISIPLPDFEARERLITVLLQKKRLAFDVAEGARTLTAMSEGKGMSGRDLASWVSRAERKALPRAIAARGPQHFAPDGRRLRLGGDGSHRLRLSRNHLVSLNIPEVESAYEHPSDGRNTACHTHHGPRSSVERRGIGGHVPCQRHGAVRAHPRRSDPHEPTGWRLQQSRQRECKCTAIQLVGVSWKRDGLRLERRLLPSRRLDALP
jgi:SpoVK/Ycf46/Vps4 family AAA+-type ATPase